MYMSLNMGLEINTLVFRNQIVPSVTISVFSLNHHFRKVNSWAYRSIELVYGHTETKNFLESEYLKTN